jgi:hypothetical protein
MANENLFIVSRTISLRINLNSKKKFQLFLYILNIFTKAEEQFIGTRDAITQSTINLHFDREWQISRSRAKKRINQQSMERFCFDITTSSPEKLFQEIKTFVTLPLDYNEKFFDIC